MKLPCHSCNNLFNLSDMMSVPVPNGPDDFDLEFMCRDCNDRLAAKEGEDEQD